MSVIISSKSSLMDYAKEILLNNNGEEEFLILYNAESDIMLPGVIKCYVLPRDNENTAYLACELMSIDGGVYYGICIYSYDDEEIYFTDWYSMCRVNINDYIRVH